MCVFNKISQRIGSIKNKLYCVKTFDLFVYVIVCHFGIFIVELELGDKKKWREKVSVFNFNFINNYKIEIKKGYLTQNFATHTH